MNKFTVFFCTGLLAFTLLFTGCTGSSLSKADEAKSRMQYKIAADLYTILGPKVKGPNAKEDQARAREEAAYCYRMANEYEKALKAYEKVLKKDPKNTEALYQIGVMSMKVSGGKNADSRREARDYFKKFLEQVPKDILELDQYLQAKDLSKTRAQIHKLKSSLDIFGLQSISSQLASIPNYMNGSNGDEHGLLGLRKAFHKLLECLKHHQWNQRCRNDQ